MRTKRKKCFRKIRLSTTFCFAAILSLLAIGCKFFSTTINPTPDDPNTKVTAISFDKTTLNINKNESDYIKVKLNPSDVQGKVNIEWEYDSNFISVQSDNFGAVITGVKAGSTYIKAKCNNIIATCLISIIANGDDPTENPYIYSNFSVVELKPNDSTTINASLYGGSVAEMEMFEWSISDPQIAEISYSRNNCVIKAIKPGSTQVVCTHPNAEYSYSFVVYVYTDAMKEPFITTDYNILTINKNETTSKSISVDLVNPLNGAYKHGFSWDYADDQSKEIIELSANLNTAEVVPLNNGIAKILVTHENSKYPLEILVRVNTIVKNTFIHLSEPNLVINGSDTTHTVYATIENYDGHADPEKFVWEVPEEAKAYMEFYSSGNSFSVVGKKNGSFKVKVSHELSSQSRNLLIILQEQIGSAIDSSMYITTDQNYVQTKVGADPTTINIRLVGGIEGEDNVGDDSNNFSWWIDGGTSNGIVEIESSTGTVKDLSSRSALTSGNSAGGQLVINPLKEGELKIIVSHPRCLYDTEIKVKVFSQSALVNPVTIMTDDSLIRLINGQSKTITATLRNHTAGQENDIQWTSSKDSIISVSPEVGQTTQIQAIGSGSNQTYITAHLEGALSDKKILVLSADTQEALDAMKGIYADSTYLRISEKEVKELSVKSFGLSSTDRITWSTSSDSTAIVSADSSSENSSVANVTGISAGKCTITASIDGAESLSFDVTVLEEGQSSEIFDENAGYLTTNLNAVVLESTEQTTNLSVTGVNITPSDMQLYTNWSMSDIDPVEDDPVFDLIGSPGQTVTLTANRPGKSKINITNKFSENSLTINAKCGELYEWTEGYIVYITTENDVVNIVNGNTTTVGCSLVNSSATGTYSWQVIEGADVIEIIGLSSGTCNISTLQAGQAVIQVSNTLAETTKEILVNVANSEQELKGFRYLSTTQNVVTVGQNSNTSVHVEIKNADSDIVTGYSWRSTNSSVCEVVGSGNFASIQGKAIGTAKIIVENYTNCDYPLEIIVNVVDPVAAAQDPYITCNSIVTCTVGGDIATIAAELIGGVEADNTGFTWTIVDKNIATLYGNNDSAQIKAIEEGVTQVIISHPKASVDRRVLVICEPKIVTNCYIDVTESIIKMSPSDTPRTINASLINGSPDDVYNFKWWADSYEKINMNYTGGSCLIEPLASGVVTIHCSHPKASAQKDIVLYISQYSDFAFSQSYVELETGTDMFLNMEVPATGVDCEISYKSSDPSVCTVFGNSSVVTLHPGTVPEGLSSTTATITATLQTKGGVKQAEAQLLVSVTKKDQTKPYIGMLGGEATIVTLNKGAKKNLSAQLFGQGIVDTGNANLQWTINGADQIIRFTSTKTTGKDVQIEALNPGKTTITITHNESKNPLTLYIIVAGVSEPTVTLNYVELPIYIGEDAQTLMATVQNDTGEELQWTIVNDIDGTDTQDFFTFTSKGNKATIYAKAVGEATIYCSIPSNNSTASCKVKILEPEKIEFFVYDKEGANNRVKNYVNSLNIYPGESKILHYETIPLKDKIKGELYRSDNSYFNINHLGYVESYEDPVTKQVYTYPEGVGTVVVTGTTKAGNAFLQATTVSQQVDSISITNGYNYLFTVNKSIVNTTPDKLHGDNTILYVTYEVRPAAAKLYITDLTTNLNSSANLQMESGSYANTYKDNGRTVWVIDSHESVDSVTGIARGTLKFKAAGEINANVGVDAVNENLVSINGVTPQPEKFSTQRIRLQSFYSKHSFIPTVKKSVPYINHQVYSATEKNATSFYDSPTNTFFLGDGEYMSGTVAVDSTKQPYSNVKILSVTFEPSNSAADKDSTGSDGKTQSQWVGGISGSSANNQSDFVLYHQMDYCGEINYKDASGVAKKKTARFYQLTNTNDASAEHYNDTVKTSPYVGNLKIRYYSVALDQESSYNIPIYVRVRNNPCASNSNYNY